MIKRYAFLVAACALLAACATTPTVYAPQAGDGPGWSQRQIESDRFRVSFSARSDMDFDRAEDYARRRAAELTLEEGFDWFELVASRREGNDRPRTRVGGSVGGFWGSGGLSGSSVGLGVGIDGNAGEKTVTLEILLRRGETPPGEPRAYDARDLLANFPR